MAVTPITTRGTDPGAGRFTGGGVRALGAPGQSAESGPVRSRPLATASSEDDIGRQVNRLQRLLAGGEIDRRARRGSYINIVV
jgi:hypothetical protein